MELGPVEIIYCWQALLLAIIISFCTTLAKQATNVVIPSDTKSKPLLLLLHFGLPALPLLLGFFMGIFSGLQPEKLVDYVATRNMKHISDIKYPWLLYGCWGSSIGVFSDYLYARVKTLLDGVAALRPASSTPVPSPPSSNL